MDAKELTAKDLLEECEKAIKGKNRLGYLLKSITSDFKGIRDIVSGKTLVDSEIGWFLKICNNRINHAKTLMKQLTTSLSILISAFLVFISILIKDILEIRITESDYQQSIFYNNFIKLSLPLQIFLGLVIVILVISLISLIFYRIEYHAWYGFKEGALLLQEGKETESED